MTSDQFRVMYELAVGREIVTGPDGGSPKWKDKRPKPSLAKDVIGPLIENGILSLSNPGADGGLLSLSDFGKTILEERAGHS